MHASMLRELPRLAAIALLGLLGARSADAIVIIGGADQFPVPGSIYELAGPSGPITLPDPGGPGTIDVEILSMELVSAGPSIGLPSGGGTERVDSFFDVFVKLDVGGATFDSFFDVFVEIDVTEDAPGTWDTELLSMDLSGDVGGLPIRVRASQTNPSLGQHTVAPPPLPNDPGLQVDSFFDVFVELSLGGQPFTPVTQPLHLELTRVQGVAEPASAALAFLGLAGVARLRRRRGRATR